MSHAFVGVIGGNVAGSRFHSLAAVAHGDGGSYRLEHSQVVFTVAYRGALVQRNPPQQSQQGQGAAFVDSGRYQLKVVIVGGGEFYALEL